jgi:hypothetical protein
MLAMPVAYRTGEDSDEDLWPELPDDANDILEDRVLRPVGPSVWQAFGVTEVERTRKELSGTVEFTGPEQFLGPKHTQSFAQFGPNEVLATLASREG